MFLVPIIMPSFFGPKHHARFVGPNRHAISRWYRMSRQLFLVLIVTPSFYCPEFQTPDHHAMNTCHKNNNKKILKGPISLLPRSRQLVDSTSTSIQRRCLRERKQPIFELGQRLTYVDIMSRRNVIVVGFP